MCKPIRTYVQAHTYVRVFTTRRNPLRRTSQVCATNRLGLFNEQAKLVQRTSLLCSDAQAYMIRMLRQRYENGRSRIHTNFIPKHYFKDKRGDLPSGHMKQKEWKE